MVYTATTGVVFMKNLSPSRFVNSNDIVIMVYPALEYVLGRLCMGISDETSTGKIHCVMGDLMSALVNSIMAYRYPLEPLHNTVRV